jgi:diguanylate cyclase (GGDEF)-like protein
MIASLTTNHKGNNIVRFVQIGQLLAWMVLAVSILAIFVVLTQRNGTTPIYTLVNSDLQSAAASLLITCSILSLKKKRGVTIFANINIILISILLINISHRLFPSLAGHTLNIRFLNQILLPNTDIVTLLILFFLSLSFLFAYKKQSITSQFCVGISLLFPIMSATNFVSGCIPSSHYLSPLMTVFGFGLSISLASLTANRWIIRALLALSIGGKISRFQLVASMLIPLSISIACSSFKHNSETDGDFFPLCIALVGWLFGMTIAASAIIFEQVDTKRRETEQELYQASVRDPLTGIFNRRFFFEFAKKQIAKGQHLRIPTSVILYDIDHFKNINDQYGHDLGDTILQEIAHSIELNGRLSDNVCRYGGEEFATLLPNTNTNGALVVAERVREIVRKRTSGKDQIVQDPVTISAGIACSKTSSLSIDKLIKYADQALYEAKQNGRDSVVFYDFN